MSYQSAPDELKLVDRWIELSQRRQHAAQPRATPAPAEHHPHHQQQHQHVHHRPGGDRAGGGAQQRPEEIASEETASEEVQPSEEKLEEPQPSAEEAEPPEPEVEERTPEALRCPISQTLFFDPVIASDGYTYERAFIMEHLGDGTTPAKSPITRGELTHTLKPNLEILQQVVEERARRLRQITLAPLPDAVDAAIMAVARQHRSRSRSSSEREERCLERERDVQRGETERYTDVQRERERERERCACLYTSVL
jgi:hypothetical protein